MLKIKDKNVTFFYFGNRNQTNDSNQKILENRLTINNQYRCKEGNKANMWDISKGEPISSFHLMVCNPR